MTSSILSKFHSLPASYAESGWVRRNRVHQRDTGPALGQVAGGMPARQSCMLFDSVLCYVKGIPVTNEHPLLAGPNLCDKRRSLAETKQAFPGVDFSLIETDDDPLYEKLHNQRGRGGMYLVGESDSAVARRGREFLHLIMTR